MADVADHPAPWCPRCGYDLTGLGDRACAECGLEAPARPGRAVELYYRPWLHRFAIVFVALTFCLIMLGGTVTSKGVGMSVPDWPTTYGQNMFLFPPSQWVAGVFWEHTHRLLGAVVGMVAIGMAVSLWITQRDRPWLRKLGVFTLFIVIVQGVMGGLRVTEMSVTLGALHGITAQMFLCLTVLIAAATGKMWLSRIGAVSPQWREGVTGAKRLAVVFLGVLLMQLVLGATMRHTGAGLAIPDFPSSFGRLVPPMTRDGVEQAADDYIALHGYDIAFAQQMNGGVVTAAQVAHHYSHRVWAVVVVLVALWYLTVLAKHHQPLGPLRVPMAGIVLLLIVQVMLGASIIWTGRHPEVATAHQATGAAILATAFLLTIHTWLVPPAAHRSGLGLTFERPTNEDVRPRPYLLAAGSRNARRIKEVTA